MEAFCILVEKNVSVQWVNGLKLSIDLRGTKILQLEALMNQINSR